MTRCLTVFAFLLLNMAATADQLFVSNVPPPMITNLAYGPAYSAYVSPVFVSGYQWPFASMYGHYGYPWNGWYGFNYGLQTPIVTFPALTATPFGYYGGNPYRSYPWYDSRVQFLLASFDSDLWTVQDPPRNWTKSTLAEGQALLKLNVALDAEVLIDGARTQQVGPVRTFVTSPLTGPTAYDVKVRRVVGGNVVEYATKVTMNPGDQASLHVFQ